MKPAIFVGVIGCRKDVGLRGGKVTEFTFGLGTSRSQTLANTGRAKLPLLNVRPNTKFDFAGNSKHRCNAFYAWMVKNTTMTLIRRKLLVPITTVPRGNR
jgi:hypothetical protein